LLKAGIITRKALIKWEEIWTFINVNGVKVALQKLKAGGKKRSWTPLDLEKWK
jgi:hypothetical protein